MNQLNSNLEILNSFDENNLPDLDVCVLGALELFDKTELPSFDFDVYSNPIVVGSGNALTTGHVLFDESNSVFADESTYEKKLRTISSVNGAILISASGSKHAIGISKSLSEKNIPITMLTNNTNAPAKEFLNENQIVVFPKNREPYTYNTSTYMGMILSKTKENPESIHQFITETAAKVIPSNFTEYDSFFMIIPPEFNAMREMLLTKFDELFGSKVSGRVFTLEQAKHAKTVVPSEKECFISFGERNDLFGEEGNRIHIPLPNNVGYGALMAISYFLIGQIQKQHPPYFKENIAVYAKAASKMFGHTIMPIVEL